MVSASSCDVFGWVGAVVSSWLPFRGTSSVLELGLTTPFAGRTAAGDAAGGDAVRGLLDFC